MTTMTINQIRRSAGTALIVAILCVLGASPLAQTGTVMPVPKQQFFDNNGLPLASGKLYTYSAGTTTPLATYTDVNLSVANTNPIILDSAGRATVFLTSASYKFVLATTADVVIWTADNISSVAPFNVDLDVTGTAGETLAANDLVYLSDGSGSLTAGRWYKADADLAYASTRAPQLGVAIAAISSGSSGSIRQAGRVTGLSALSVGSDYYISGTAGAITNTPPTNAVRVGRADSSTTLVLGNVDAPSSPRGPPCGRLTLTTNVPVTVSDVTAATTLYYTPYVCNQISVFSGTTWATYAFAQLSIAVPASTNQMYDVFVYDNAGVLTLELTAWTNDTTRATALTTQNGVLVKTGATTRLYLGSFRTTGVSGQTEDSYAKRFVWNYYNRVKRSLRVTEAANSWNYTTGAWTQANGTTANQVAVVVGVAEVEVLTEVWALVSHDAGTANAYVNIGKDSASVPASNTIGNTTGIPAANVQMALTTSLVDYPAVGYHFYAWLTYGPGSGTLTWYGDNGGAVFTQSGIFGSVWG